VTDVSGRKCEGVYLEVVCLRDCPPRWAEGGMARAYGKPRGRDRGFVCVYNLVGIESLLYLAEDQE